MRDRRGHLLTEEGLALGSLIRQFARAILELDENGRAPLRV
jgi:hypothetical protein